MRLTNLLFLTVYLFDCENYLGNESIGVRAGGRGGLQPPQILGNSDFLGSTSKSGQSQFLKTSPCFYYYYFEEINISYFILKSA